jgi:hypothetical protein
MDMCTIIAKFALDSRLSYGMSLRFLLPLQGHRVTELERVTIFIF